MTDSVAIMAMHSQMHTLFPDHPERWNWIETGEDIDQAIKEHGGDVEILLSASIEKLDKAREEWDKQQPAHH